MPLVAGKIWGGTARLFTSDSVIVEYINFKRGYRCSKHKHQYRTNRFFCMEGILKIEIWKNYAGNKYMVDETYLKPGEMCDAPPNEFHRFVGIEDGRALEIYYTKISDSDIVRQNQGGGHRTLLSLT